MSRPRVRELPSKGGVSMRRHDADASSGKLSVWSTGHGTCDLLLIHSLGSSGSTFEQMCEFLPEVGCVAPDLWGHGGTPRREGVETVDIDRIADDIATLLPVGSRPVVMGVSFGGIVAQAFAARHPDSLRALVLCNTVARWAGARERLEQQKDALRAAPSPEAWRRKRNVLVEDASRRSVAAYLEATDQCTPEDYMRAAGAAYLTDTTEYWERITCPAFVITGERETRVPAEATAYLAAVSRADSIRVVPGAGHLSHLDRPRETACVVRQILAERERG